MSNYSTYLLANYSTGLLCYYLLNDATTPWQDSGPNNLPLTSHAGFTLAQPSLLPFDAGSTANGCTLFSGGYGSQASPPAAFSGLTAFTLAAWCQPPLASGASGPLSYLFSGTAGRWAASINVSGASLYPQGQAQAALAPANTAGAIGPTKDTVQANIPSFVVALYDGADINIIVNGVLIAQTAKTGALGALTPYGVAANGAGADLFAGYIQHVTMWNRALSLANIQDLYVQAIQGAHPGAAGATFQAYAFPWSQEVLPANALRERVTFANDSDAVIWLQLAASGAAVGNGIQLLPSSKWTCETYLGAFCAIHGWAQGYKSLTIQEE